MAQPPSFSSNNPFRRKGPVPSAPAPPANIPPFDEADAPSPTPETVPALPSADRFRTQLHALSTSNQPPPATSFQKPKVVKKVRVQSPPPSSPESPRAENRFPPVTLDDEDSSSSDETDEAADPFSYASSTGSADVSDRGDDPQPVPLHRPPPNPFQKTLRELEFGAAEPEQNPATAQATTRGALDPPPPTTAPTKLVPPPPPPARNASVRGKKRPVSGAPDAALARKSSITTSGGKGKEQPPPPPRPRNRGNSGASIDAPVPVPVPLVPAVVGHSGAAGAPEKAEDLAGLETSASASAAGDILADLSALQREVDALRGVYQQAGTE
ncbi:hypothetical protein NEMBOFW57_003873 [Staphylotrichum longicolle]|uniref:Uncharacterized protein n=1 Tax=Staphylotrichum longicolle TaxID=669026 RepID=A0AAD4F5R2_9PEZI|nr:hypothetical protein NEMBOFW57_003873 [Staphylotrichum longicolle]